MGIFLGAFVAGITSFFSPCILPLIPIYISFVTGYSIDELKSGRVSYRDSILRATAFIAGFSVIFVSMGVASSAVGSFLLANKILFARISGIILIFFGLYLLDVFKLDFLSRTRRMNVNFSRYGIASSFVFGLIFAFGWSPCVGPMLSSILIIAADSANMAKGAALLFVYSLGIGLPFLFATLFLDLFLRFSSVVSRMNVVQKIAGVLLVLAGAYMTYNGGF